MRKAKRKNQNKLNPTDRVHINFNQILNTFSYYNQFIKRLANDDGSSQIKNLKENNFSYTEKKNFFLILPKQNFRASKRKGKIEIKKKRKLK
jgi:hypothetical protein